MIALLVAVMVGTRLLAAIDVMEPMHSFSPMACSRPQHFGDVPAT